MKRFRLIPLSVETSKQHSFDRFLRSSLQEEIQNVHIGGVVKEALGSGMGLRSLFRKMNRSKNGLKGVVTSG